MWNKAQFIPKTPGLLKLLCSNAAVTLCMKHLTSSWNKSGPISVTLIMLHLFSVHIETYSDVTTLAFLFSVWGTKYKYNDLTIEEFHCTVETRNMSVCVRLSERSGSGLTDGPATTALSSGGWTASSSRKGIFLSCHDLILTGLPPL